MLKVEPVALTDVGRKRSINQDYLGDLIFKSGRSYGQEKLNERGYLFAVADGMGGYAGGEVASELAITTLFERFYNGPSSGDIATDLSEAIRLANSQVHDTAATSGRPQMGTTLTAVLLKGNKAIFGNVGDSRTYLIRQGIPERVTHDHSLVQDQIDAGVLTPEQAERSSIKNFITRAIGHRNVVESDLFEREIEAGDVLLLCSDGLHGLVKEVEMGSIVATTPQLMDAARQLLDMALERGGHDNISVMLVRVLETGEPLPPILNGREARFNTTDPIYSQTTAEIPLISADGENNYTTIAMSGQTTAPVNVVSQAPVAPPLLEDQTTVPLATLPRRPRTGGKGLLIGLLLLALLAGAALAYLLLSGSSPTLAPTATPVLTPVQVPRATPTVTATPISTTPASLPTTTPLTVAATPAQAPGAAAAIPARTAGAAAAERTSSLGGGAQAPATVTGPGIGNTAGPGFSLPNDFASPAVSPGRTQMTPWPVINISQVQTLRVRLPNTSGSTEIRLVGQSAPGSTNSLNLNVTRVNFDEGIYEASLPVILTGDYRLEITTTPGNAVTSALRSLAVKVEPDRIVADPTIKVSQAEQGRVLVLDLT